MPPVAKNGSNFISRNATVRSRVKHVFLILSRSHEKGIAESPVRYFLHVCDKIAAERGMRWYKKPIPSKIMKFVKGEQNSYGYLLDVMELACIEIEQETKQKPVVLHHAVVTEESAGHWVAPTVETAELKAVEMPADVQALADVIAALDPLTEDEKCAVVGYVSSRYGISL
jgi:hypothetical protein